MRAAGPIVGQGNVIADNTGNVGGVTATGIGASISLQDSTISGNHGLVGGVAGPLDLNRVTLRANVGTVAGGFVGTGAIVASTVDDNDGPLAGAGYTDGFGGQSLSILRSTIADNTGGRVGGVGLDTSTAVAPGPSSQPHVSFAASTLVGNSASAADGADDLGFLNESHAPAGLPNNPNGSITTEATVFASTAGGKPSCFLDGHPVTSNGVNYSADASCGLGAGDLVDLGDPELLPLERTQASPLEVRLPGRGSVLRDQIRPGEHWCTVVDEAGIGLPQGPRCDIGAAEAVLGGFHPPFGPVRLYDSRDTHSPLAAGETRTIQVQPHQFAARMSALLVNATVVNPSADTHLTIWPSDGAEPATSNLNASAHETIANQVLVPIGTGATPGSVKVFNNAGSSDVVVDLAGFYDDGTVAPPSTVACPCGDGFAPLGMPVRLVDTRDGHGGSTTAFGPHEARTYSLGGVAGLPADAAAVALNVTITGADSSSHLSIGPGSVPSTGSSTLNWSAGETVANGATVTVPAGKDVTIYNNEGHVQVIVDVVGSYSPTAAARLRVIDPARFTDSRFTGPTGGNNPFGAGETRTFAVSSLIAPQSTGITSAWFNVTGVQASVDTHLTVWPGDVGLPATSTLNVPTHGTRANLTPVGLGSTGSIKIRNNSGQMNVIADLFGWFATNG
jgi:hypothetical protein